MFGAEARGLELLEQTKAFRIPEVYQVTNTHLLMEYIPEGNKQQVNGERFGRALARLHSHRKSEYGLPDNNYIGSLRQSNKPHKSGGDFYRNERLLPQFKMATEKGFRFKDLEAFLNKLDGLIPEEEASLIHGDLWSGNYMVSRSGEPCLIDPAVSYANREMDLAMMALFGGFPKTYTYAYEEVYPLQPGWQERIALWQLYYILVHLNLFGSGYYSRVIQIMKRYL